MASHVAVKDDKEKTKFFSYDYALFIFFVGDGNGISYEANDALHVQDVVC